MIHTLARTKSSQLLDNVPLERLSAKDVAWFWVDFETPDRNETALLSDFFKF